MISSLGKDVEQIKLFLVKKKVKYLDKSKKHWVGTREEQGKGVPMWHESKIKWIRREAERSVQPETI